MEKVQQIIEVIEELLEDNTVPRNVKRKLEISKEILGSEDELSIKVNKVLNELEELSEDTNVQSYTRTQIWNLVSMLEML